MYENIKKMTIFEKQELLVSEEKTVSKEGGNLGQFSRPFFFSLTLDHTEKIKFAWDLKVPS